MEGRMHNDDVFEDEMVPVHNGDFPEDAYGPRHPAPRPGSFSAYLRSYSHDEFRARPASSYLAAPGLSRVGVRQDYHVEAEVHFGGDQPGMERNAICPSLKIISFRRFRPPSPATAIRHNSGPA